MTPKEIVKAALVPGTKRVFVLGCFEQRVTVYSQQVRALNLVDAMLSQEMMRLKGGKVAIVGGGVAGMTAAVALAKAAPDLAQLDLFETRSGVLQLQHNSRRFLHPHFYDWPAPVSYQSDAGLPIMNWQAGPAGDVARAIVAEFDQTVCTSRLKVYTDLEVVELKPIDLGPVRVVTRGGTATNRIYDAVILAIGFGIERFLGSENSSYWTPSELSAPILAQVHEPIIFISGNGDGGLVDFLMAAFNSLEHSDICRLLIELDLGAARAELEAIEQQAWAADADADVDLLAEYQARVRDLVPTAVWSAINDQLRPNVRIYLHTRETRLLRRATALHNRFATFLVLETDRAMGHDAISVKVGVDFAGLAPEVGDVSLVGEPTFQPFKRFLRLGPDSALNLTPFATLLEQCRAAASALKPGTRPASPTLTASAHDRFEPFRVTVGSAVEAPAAPAANPGAQSISVTFVEPGRVAWAGGIGPANIDLTWADGSVIDIYCDVNAADASRLMPAIARLGAHAQGLTLFVRDSARWRAALGNLWSVGSHPGPALSFCCLIEEWREPPPGLAPVIEASVRELADMIHDRLDAQTLKQLHDVLFDRLSPIAVPTGWPIESALRERLWELWQGWYGTVALDTDKRRRFLRLLTSVNDKVDVDDGALVRLGPKVVGRYLAMPTIFALTFAVCSGRTVEPAVQHPGNVAVDVLTGHTCGVEWIEARAIRSGMVGQHTWTTSVVLLSELREAVQLMEGDLRLDQVISDPPKVGVPSLSERPIVIGADGEFLNALEEGKLAVQRYFQSIFQRRADAARKSLEEV